MNTPESSSELDAVALSEQAQAASDGGMLAEITRVARDLFAGRTSPGTLAPVVPANVGTLSPVTHVEPVPRGGGLSPAALLPQSPAPFELALPLAPPVGAPGAGSDAKLDTPYFLALAGFPVADVSAIPVRAAPVDAAPVGAAQPAPEDTPLDPLLGIELGPEFFGHGTAVPAISATRAPYDAHSLKRDFPILQERVHGRPLVWLDNAATTQKPRAVIERLKYFYEHENSNIHRAAHTLAGRATDAYEAARDKVRRFLNAPSPREIVFVRGGTEAINLVAQSWGRRHVSAGDEIVISWLEHHANIVPWQLLAKEKGARLRVIPVDERGQVLLDDYERLLGPRTRLVALTHVSNALGTVVPVREMTASAHRYGARVLLDGAQAVSHLAVDVHALDCDFYCFSGHKVFAPTGIGALFGKADVLESMPPWQGGGNMIADVTFERTTYQPPPNRFEAGTGNIADAVGLGAALDYVTGIGLEAIGAHEHELLVYGTECLLGVPGLRLVGTAPDKAGVLSFVLDGQRTEDIGAALDQEGIAVRSGHHCAQPSLRRFGLEATVRASLALYNTRDDIDALVAALHRLQAHRPARAS